MELKGLWRGLCYHTANLSTGGAAERIRRYALDELQAELRADVQRRRMRARRAARRRGFRANQAGRKGAV